MSTGILTLAIAAAVARADTAVPPEPSAKGEPTKVVLTPAQMLALGQVAVDRGDTSTAAAIYSSLAADPNSDVRNEARFRHSKILAAAGQKTRAALLLRQVIDEKPAATPARLELASLLASIGDSDGAWRQLRAAEAAGLPPDVARIVDRYSQALRASRPSGRSVEVAIAPSTNINRATRSDTLGTVFGDFEIDEEAKAKTGTGLAVRGQAFRRFAMGSGTTHVLIRALATADLYKQPRYNQLAVDLAAGPEFRLDRGRVNLEVGATERWFGQKPFYRSARVAVTATRPLGGRTQLRMKATAALVDNRRNNLEDGRNFIAEAAIERALSPTTGIAATVSVLREALNEPAYSTTGWRLGAIGWRDLGRVTLTAAAEFGRLRADDRLSLFPEARSDRYSRFSLGAAFRQVTLGGFAPILRFTRERNRSSVAFYDYSRSQTEFGFERAF